MVACEGHPLLVPRVRRYLDHELDLRDSAAGRRWRRHWTVETLAALEGHLAGHKATGQFCHGDAPTLADICLVGHVTGGDQRSRSDLSIWPTVKRIFETAMALPAFANGASVWHSRTRRRRCGRSHGASWNRRFRQALAFETVVRPPAIIALSI